MKVARPRIREGNMLCVYVYVGGGGEGVGAEGKMVIIGATFEFVSYT